MKLYKLASTAIVVALALNTSIVLAANVDIFSSGNKIVSADSPSRISFIQADEIRVGEGLQAEIYTEEKYQGTKTIVKPNTTSTGLAFKSFQVVEHISTPDPSKPLPPATGPMSMALTGVKCMHVAVSIANDQGAYTSIYPNGEGFPEVGNPMAFGTYKRFCPGERVDLYKLAQAKFGAKYDDHEMLIRAYVVNEDNMPLGMNLSMYGQMAKDANSLGMFNEYSVMGNYQKPERFVKVDNTKGYMTLGVSEWPVSPYF